MLQSLPLEILTTHILSELSALSELSLAATCKALRAIVDKAIRADLAGQALLNGQQSLYAIHWAPLYYLRQWPVILGHYGMDHWLIYRRDFKWIKWFGAENIRKRLLGRVNSWHYVLGRRFMTWIKTEIQEDEKDDACDQLIDLANVHLLPHVDSEGLVLIEKGDATLTKTHRETFSKWDIVSEDRREPTREDQAKFIKSLFQQRFGHTMDAKVDTWMLMNIEYIY
jgi:hypothetical protein